MPMMPGRISWASVYKCGMVTDGYPLDVRWQLDTSLSSLRTHTGGTHRPTHHAV